MISDEKHVLLLFTNLKIYKRRDSVIAHLGSQELMSFLIKKRHHFPPRYQTLAIKPSI